MPQGGACRLSSEYGTADIITAEQEERLNAEHQIMRQTKRKRKAHSSRQEPEENVRNTRRRIDRLPRIDHRELPDEEYLPTHQDGQIPSSEDHQVRADII